jgi:M6 family metalloprotease-like protein
MHTCHQLQTNGRASPLGMGTRPRPLARWDAATGVLRWLAFLGCWFVLHAAMAAPYPPDGLLSEWVQPDGTHLTLRVFGDEFYGRTTTKDGYTVVFDAAAKTYYYAVPGADGKSPVASGVTADQKPPPQLSKHLLEPSASVAAVRDANIRQYAPERAARWAARVKAVQLQRTRAAVVAPAAASGTADILGVPVAGNKIGLMILVQFPDDTATGAADPTDFPTTQAKILRYCNESGYADDGSTGSIKDYFYDQSNGQLTHTQVVTTIVTLPHPRNYYNFTDYPNNTTLPGCGVAGRLLVADAIAKLKSDNFNFSTLSLNANNQVIATSLLFAGGDSGVWAKGLWPHSYSVAAPGINVGTSGSPRYIYDYQCTNVPGAEPVIGTVCHEIGHMLMEYPDFYDTDSSDGASAGVGEHCLMGSGNYLNSQKTPAPIDLYLKDYSGWANITDISPTQSLDDVLPATGNRGYRIRKPGSTTEYFLIENRGAGDKWATYCRDNGIAIWHVDEAVTTDNKRQQMTASQHYELSLEQADGLFHLENNQGRGDASDLFDITTGLFNDGTNPHAAWWSGSASSISIAVLSAPAASMNVSFGSGIPVTTLTLNPTTKTVTAAGTGASFTVVSNTQWSWSDDASWVTSSEATSQTGDQTFTYTVAANTAPSSRIAVITLTGGGLTRTHTITQTGANIDDHGNSIATATPVELNAVTSGSIEAAGDNDYFRVNVTGGGSLTVETTGDTDTYGYLLDAAGNQLAYDDDTGVATNFRINYPVTAGIYYVRVRHYYSTGTGSYQLLGSLANTVTLTVSPPTQSVVALSANYSFNVTSNTSWSWGVNASWVTSSESTNQSGDQTFTYTVAVNPLTVSRTAVITLTAGALTATHTITQAGTGTDDHGNSIADATLLGLNASVSGRIEYAGDNDFFRIDISIAGSLTVETTGDTDTYGSLLDASGNQLAYDDDAGVDSNFSISYAVAPGTYYVQVRHYLSSGTGSYQLLNIAGGADDHGDDIATATVIGQNSTTSGTIGFAGDNDYFRVNISVAGSLTVETAGSTDTYGYLLDATGNQLASNDDTGEARNFRLSYAVTAGTYYVRVRHYSSTEAGAYQLVSSLVAADFTAWIATFDGLDMADRDSAADPDRDGLNNAAEMVLGGNPAVGMDASLLPTTQLVSVASGDTVPAGEYLLFTHRRTAASVAAGVSAGAAYAAELAGPWTRAITGTDGVSVLEDHNYYASGIDRIQTYIPRGANSRIFVRLHMLVP